MPTCSMTDQWTQRLSLVAVTVTFLVAISAILMGVSCWCPNVFTNNHVDYTQTICAKGNTSRYRAAGQIGNVSTHVPKYDRMVEALASQDTCLLKLLAWEALLVCCGYVILADMTRCSPLNVTALRMLRNKYCRVPMYILVQVLMAFLWAMFAAFTHLGFVAGSVSDQAEPFLCNFEIRHLGNVHRYTIQCVDGGDSLMHVAAMMNMSLCSLVAVVKVVHLVLSFGVRPFTKFREIGEVLVEKKVIEDATVAGSAFGFSDLYFVVAMTTDCCNALKSHSD